MKCCRMHSAEIKSAFMHVSMFGLWSIKIMSHNRKYSRLSVVNASVVYHYVEILLENGVRFHTQVYPNLRI